MTQQDDDRHMKPFKQSTERRKVINNTVLKILSNNGFRLPGHVKLILKQATKIARSKCDCNSIPLLEKLVGGVEDYHESFSRARCISCNARYILYDFTKSETKYGTEDFIRILKSFNTRYNCNCSLEACNICATRNLTQTLYKRGLIN